MFKQRAKLLCVYEKYNTLAALKDAQLFNFFKGLFKN